MLKILLVNPMNTTETFEISEREATSLVDTGLLEVCIPDSVTFTERLESATLVTHQAQGLPYSTMVEGIQEARLQNGEQPSEDKPAGPQPPSAFKGFLGA